MVAHLLVHLKKELLTVKSNCMLVYLSVCSLEINCVFLICFIGSNLVLKAIRAMVADDADEVKFTTLLSLADYKHTFL